MAGTDAFRGIPRDWRIIVGLALIYAWSWLLYWGGPFSLRGHTMELANTRWAGHVVACALVIGAIAFVACKRPRGRRLMGGIRWAGLAGALGGTALALWLVITPPSAMESFLLVAFLSGVLTGVGGGCLLCLWCTITSSLGMRVALASNVVAMAASGLLFLLCNAIPAVSGLVVGLACPLVSAACSLGHHGYSVAFSDSGTSSNQAQKDRAEADRADPSTVIEANHNPAQKSRLSRKPSPQPQKPPVQPQVISTAAALLADRSFLTLAAIALVFGLSCGFVLASFEVVPKADYWTASYGVIVGTILAAALAFLTAFVLKMDAWQLVFQTSLPLMAAAYLLYPYGGVCTIVSPGLHTLGFQYFFVTFWSLLGSKQLRHDVPAVCSVTIGLFVVNAGQAVGLGLWNLLCMGIDQTGLHIAVSVAVFALVVAAVLFEHPAFGWGNVRPGEAPRPDTGDRDLPYEAVIERLRRDYGLSPREHDVCLLLGRGRNRQFVADELSISLETAKTHATNVYRKLGVHSQQELLDVIEMTQDTLGRELRQDARP